MICRTGAFSELYCSVGTLMDLNVQEIQELCAMKEQHWPYSLAEQQRWWNENSDPTDLLVRLFDKGHLRAFLRLRAYEVICGNNVYPAKCATEVSVDKSFIRKGIGRRLMCETIRVINREGIPLGYLLCTSAQEQFYVKSGWVPISDVSIRKHRSQQGRVLDINQRCFVYDPSKIIHGPVLLTGRVF